MAVTMSGTLYNTLKPVLDMIMTDEIPNEKGALVHRLCKVTKMKDAYEDVLDTGGPGLISQTEEGEEFGTGTIREGTKWRVIARKWGLKLLVSREIVEDSKYPDAIKAARRLVRAFIKTRDIDATQMYARGFNTAYPGGDGLPLFSASHTLPGGTGTYSNLLSTAALSKTSFAAAVKAAYKLPGYDGTTDGLEIKGITYPVDLWDTVEELFNSAFVPEDNNFAKINVVQHGYSKIKKVMNEHWTSTTTAWSLMTSADGGPEVRMRRPMTSKTWESNSQELLNFLVSSRWGRFWYNPRAVLGNAGS